MVEAAINHPSAKPRPYPGASARPGARPNLHVVTPSDPALQGAAGEDTAQNPDSRTSRGSRLHPALSAVTDRDRLREVVGRVAAYWTPPQVFTDRPASLSELAEYAYHAPWTRQDYIAKPYTDEHTKKMVKTGAVRAAGIWWYRLVGYPATVGNRWTEWLWQRPGRAITTLTLVKLTASTTWGTWVVDNLLTPTVKALAWALL